MPASREEIIVRALANVDGTFNRGEVAEAILRALDRDDAEPGGSAHAWALDGEPLRNSTSGAGHTFLECPRCGDVILDVVKHQSGTLDVPRNLYSPLGLAWYAHCWECGYRTHDYRNEWDLLEAVKKVRSGP